MKITIPLESESNTVDYVNLSDLVTDLLAHPIKTARRALEDAIDEAAPKMKNWALMHMRQAQQLNKSTAVFEKIINNPQAVARQIAFRLMNVPFHELPTKHNPNATKEEKQMDSIMDQLHGLRI